MCIFCSAKSLSISTIFVATSLSSVQVAQTDIRVENNQFTASGMADKSAAGFTCDVVGQTVAAVLRPADIMPYGNKSGS